MPRSKAHTFCKPLQAEPQTQVCKKSVLFCRPRRILFFLFPPFGVFNFLPSHLATRKYYGLKTNQTVTHKRLTFSRLTRQEDRRASANIGFAKAGVQCFG